MRRAGSRHAQGSASVAGNKDANPTIYYKWDSFYETESTKEGMTEGPNLNQKIWENLL